MKLFRSILPFLLLSFVAQAQSPVKDGAIRAEFSVSDSTKVYFSQGNLQYQASTNTWRFAEHQWDFVGDSVKGNVYEKGIKSNNAKISSTYDGWIDLFGWGTSSYNGKNPYMTSTGYSDYGDGTNDIAGTNYDWGVYNKIYNGGNQAGMWRTLTSSEWNHLISGRAQANRLMGQGKVNNVNGLILLPDSWATETPSSVRFTYDPGNYSTNVYSLDEWAVMQSYGAVFLPAAGYRYRTYVNDVDSYSYLWSSSTLGNDYNQILTFNSYHVGMYFCQSHLGLSVRLVQDVK
ncbi:MAG: hypothetical protein IKJ98_09725 [Bacteroidales bacterium]|nr:hypothetical protein [Bacteroidales bacterium]